MERQGIDRRPVSAEHHSHDHNEAPRYERSPDSEATFVSGRAVPYQDNEKTIIPIETTASEETPAGDDFATDPYKPFDDLPEERQWVLTTRAVLIGIFAGALVNASNLYVGLKSGWTFGANLFGSIAGFGIISILSKFLPEAFPILGGGFGPKENNIVQTVATASGGMSSVFISAFPALYQMNLLKTPKEDFWRIVSLTAVAGYFGFFFATPLRKFFIIYLARELKLIFPTPSATALTIRSMHDALKGRATGMKKLKAMGGAFGGAMIIRIVSQYAPGILWEWHPFTWMFIWGKYKNGAIYAENWGWFIQFTPAFIGSGMLVGLNVAFSFFGGSLLAWGVIGPSLVHQNLAFGSRPWSNATDPDNHNYAKWHEQANFGTLSAKYTTKDHPSVRYWLLWPGVLTMIAISFTELFLQWRVISFSAKAGVRAMSGAIYDLGQKLGKDLKFFKMKPQDESHMVQDPAAEADLIPMWMWALGLVLSIIGMCVVMGKQFDMSIGLTLLSVFLAFFFSFLAIQCAGVTDITPLTAASKASQIVLGGATKAQGWPLEQAQRLNLLGGAMASVGANQASDLVGDFRVGFLLRTSPMQQWIGQGIGTLVAVFLAPLLFWLFMAAYPCVLNPKDGETCLFTAPSASAWKAVAIAATDPQLPIPQSSGIFAIIFAVFSSVMVLIRHFVWVGKLSWVRDYHPNMMCIALAFTLAQTFYGTAMVMGSMIAAIWAKKNPTSFEMIGYPLAAGLIAGEGIGGVVNAVFEIAGISGSKYGSHVGCPVECAG